ncbi:unnamed protein product, partial [Ectocarpus fasciculatus]
GSSSYVTENQAYRGWASGGVGATEKPDHGGGGGGGRSSSSSRTQQQHGPQAASGGSGSRSSSIKKQQQRQERQRDMPWDDDPRRRSRLYGSNRDRPPPQQQQQQQQQQLKGKQGDEGPSLAMSPMIGSAQAAGAGGSLEGRMRQRGLPPPSPLFSMSNQTSVFTPGAGTPRFMTALVSG